MARASAPWQPVFAVLAMGFAAAAHADCTGSLSAAAEGNGLRLALSAPCAPYLPVTITFGPLRIEDETGAYGSLDLQLPAVTGAGEIRVTGKGIDLAAPVPAGVAGGFVWIVPEAVQPGLLPASGMPDGGTRPELRLYPAGATPAHLDLAVSARNCGHPLRFGLLRDGWPDLRPVMVEMPGCEFEGSHLRLPLPSE